MEKAMRWTKEEKKQLLIYLIFVYGITALMSIPFGVTYSRGGDVDMFGGIQMLYPMLGVIVTIYITRRSQNNIPKISYRTYIIITCILMGLGICYMLFPGKYAEWLWGYGIIAGSVAMWITFLLEDKEKLEKYKLAGGKHTVKKVVLYIGIFFVMDFILNILIGYWMEGIGPFQTVQNEFFHLPGLLTAVPVFFLEFILFMGEEYGWRGFLQPLLQKRFGNLKGVILTGIIWGPWHLPLILWVYTPELNTWFITFIEQVAVCITLGIFIGYAYMKTDNIWVPIGIHWINNTLSVFMGNSSDYHRNTTTWRQLIIEIGVMLVVYAIVWSVKIIRIKKNPLKTI